MRSHMRTLVRDKDQSGLFGGRLPAPAELRLIQEFVNTKDVISEREAFDSPGAIADWLIERRLLRRGTTLSDRDLQLVLRVREAIRTFLGRERGGVSDLDITLLDDVGRRAGLQWTFEADGNIVLEARRSGVIGALGTIMSPLLSAALTGSLPRLKTCRNCRWVFYDYSKNRSGVWCSMGLCGSRAKARRHYQRSRAASHL
jgi:predicted RNA-binding Zn ribbon-like protein